MKHFPPTPDMAAAAAAAAYPTPQTPLNKNASIEVTRPSRPRATRTDINYSKMHSSKLATQDNGTDAINAKTKKAPASQLEAILHVVSKVQEAIMRMERRVRATEKGTKQFGDYVEKKEQSMKQTEERIARIEARVTQILQDPLYPVKVDNANCTAILEKQESMREGAIEILEKENEVKIAKIA